MAYSKNLISYFESSLYADQKSYENHGGVLQASRVTAPQICREKEGNLWYKEVFPISYNFQVQ